MLKLLFILLFCVGSKPTAAEIHKIMDSAFNMKMGDCQIYGAQKGVKVVVTAKCAETSTPAIPMGMALGKLGYDFCGVVEVSNFRNTKTGYYEAKYDVLIGKCIK